MYLNAFMGKPMKVPLGSKESMPMRYAFTLGNESSKTKGNAFEDEAKGKNKGSVL